LFDHSHPLFDKQSCPSAFQVLLRFPSPSFGFHFQAITMRSTYKMDELLKVKESAPMAVAAEVVKRIGQSEDGTRSEFGV